MILLTPWPVLAHQVELADDVGATLHIEPNDTPKAGEPSEVWFALTRKGGAIIPLADCDCNLTVYSQSATAAEPLLEPPLQPVAAEGYAAIPGATFTFPAVGAYELVLQGQPQDEASFTPFELRFDVVVAAGTTKPVVPDVETPAAPDTTETSPEPTEPQSRAWPQTLALIGGGAIVVLGIAGLVLLQRRSNTKLE
ncbi:MAG: hypothetical protein AAGG51_27085 [Cyanobacteria bacterium P01_G01_bin.54]